MLKNCTVLFAVFLCLCSSPFIAQETEYQTHVNMSPDTYPHPAYCDSLHSLGSDNYFDEKFDTAIELYREALKGRQVLLKMADGHEKMTLPDTTLIMSKLKIKIADTYENIGSCFIKRGNYLQAIDNYKFALTVWKNNPSQDQTGMATLYYNIGRAYRRILDYHSALENFKQAMSIWGKKIQIETISSRKKNRINKYISFGYNIIGLTYHDLGDYDTAIENLLNSLEIKLEIDPTHLRVAKTQNNLGLSFVSLKDYEKALTYYEESLNLKRHQKLRDYLSEAETIRNIGRLYLLQNKLDLALDAFNQALDIQQNSQGEVHPEIGETYNDIAEVYRQERDWEKSIDAVQKSLIANTELFSSNNIQKNPSIDESFSKTTLLNTVQLKGDFFLERYRREKQLNDLVDALKNFEFAMTVVDKIRSGLLVEKSKYILVEQIAGLYEKAVDNSMTLYELSGDKSYQEKIMQFSDFRKAKVLADALREEGIRRFSGLPNHLRKREQTLQSGLSYLDSNLDSLKTLKNIDENEIAELNNRYSLLKNDYSRLITQFKRDYPVYYNLKYRSEQYSIKEIQASLDEKSALLEYFQGDNKLYIICITKEDYDVKTVAIDRLDRLAKKYYLSLRKPDRRRFFSSSTLLAEILITPIAHNIAGKKRLIIIPDRSLSDLPFEALVTKMPTDEKQLPSYNEMYYLLKDYQIVYHYSRELWRQSLETVNLNKAPEQFLGMAPVFSKKEGFLEGLYTYWDAAINAFRSDNFDALPHSKTEIETISALFPENTVTTFYDEAATKSAFQNHAGNYSYVHLATHSVADITDYRRSKIIFSAESGEENVDISVLFARETFNLELNADLVVLSSCESGYGNYVFGEGMMALTRGFLYAGAKNLLVSLWKVDDEMTNRLMTNFYRAHLSGKDLASALRQAKLEILANSESPLPMYWSSFILIGQ